jgi:heme-degrading monooxygenase HmoA
MFGRIWTTSMTRNEREGVVLTLWRDEAAIRNLEASELYPATGAMAQRTHTQ